MSFECNDATNLIERSSSYDFIFTNWLFMYFNDVECMEFAKNALNWLKKDGYIFIRESCNYQSGNKERTFNPTFYRSNNYYHNLFSETLNEKYKFILKKNGNIKCYENVKNNNCQLYWLFQKEELNK